MRQSWDVLRVNFVNTAEGLLFKVIPSAPPLETTALAGCGRDVPAVRLRLLGVSSGMGNRPQRTAGAADCRRPACQQVRSGSASRWRLSSCREGLVRLNNRASHSVARHGDEHRHGGPVGGEYAITDQIETGIHQIHVLLLVAAIRVGLSTGGGM